MICLGIEIDGEEGVAQVLAVQPGVEHDSTGATGIAACRQLVDVELVGVEGSLHHDGALNRLSVVRDEDDALRRRERQAWARTEMWMADDQDGTWRFGGRLPALQAEMLKASLDAIAAPRRRHLTAEQERDQDELTYSQRTGRAFAHLVEHLPTDKLPTAGGTPALITVNIDRDDLEKQLGAATLATGTRLSGGELRRLACNQGILPMVFAGASLPIDMGRSRRLFSPAQRIAIANRDRGCVAPGCEAPPGWCEGHHWRRRWSDGGTTDIDDGGLLCSRHHHQAHDDDWQLRMADDGHIEVRKPRGVWQRNHRWRP